MIIELCTVYFISPGIISASVRNSCFGESERMVMKCLDDGRRDLYRESKKHVFMFSFVNCFLADVLLCKFSSYSSNAQLKSPFFFVSLLYFLSFLS